MLYKQENKKTHLSLENSIILPLFRMERVGLKIDRDYLKERKKFFEDYISEKRAELHKLTGEAFNVGQHAEIKKWFSKNGLELPSSDDKAMETVKKCTDGTFTKLQHNSRTT
jgi:DNA polymerase I-like protein with 3'-5' exonuclease and polymerase domains